MPASAAELVMHLADVQKRNAARDDLVKLGEAAIPALLNAAAAPLNIPHYKTILRTLLLMKDRLIKDASAEGLFRRALESDDEEIRAIGARGLHLVKAPDAMKALQATLNDAPQPFNFEQTPAVLSFIELGMDALPTVLALMESPDDRTRRRAWFVLASVVLKDINQRLRPRPLTSDAQTAWEELRRANGSYQWDAPESDRKASVSLWKQWLERNDSAKLKAR